MSTSRALTGNMSRCGQTTQAPFFLKQGSRAVGQWVRNLPYGGLHLIPERASPSYSLSAHGRKLKSKNQRHSQGPKRSTSQRKARHARNSCRETNSAGDTEYMAWKKKVVVGVSQHREQQKTQRSLEVAVTTTTLARHGWLGVAEGCQKQTTPVLNKWGNPTANSIYLSRGRNSTRPNDCDRDG